MKIQKAVLKLSGPDCMFCAFATKNKVFTEPFELPVKEAVNQAKRFEDDGANAIFVMSTADYPLKWFGRKSA
jgi:biotin synthase